MATSHPFHMDTFKPGQTQFHTFEVWNFDFLTGLTQFARPSSGGVLSLLTFNPVVTRFMVLENGGKGKDVVGW